MSEIRQKLLEGIRRGDSFTVCRTFSEEDVRGFSEISRDDNPVHDNDRFCREKGLRGTICHGLLVGSMLTEIGGELAWLASSMQFVFRRPVYPGDTITCLFTITDLDERRRACAHVRFANQDDETVIEAELRGILPSKEECDILGESPPQ